MNEKRKLEVLAPAGDLKTLKAALVAGADAVYFGGEMFGARAYAHNFSLADAEAGISFAHARGKRTYLTVNTLLKTKEIEDKVYDYLKDYYNAGIDGVLVQDIGLMQLIRAYFPELRLHISTQASVTSIYGARFFKNLGAKRIVLARELSLSEIKNIHDNCDIELECFAHGALCMSYSGQCLMSSMIGGRSGNRGRCAQPCRKCYELEGAENSLNGDYPLSLKDLCTIEDVKALYDAGAMSLKIEGRMKSPEYVAMASSMYRWAADYAESGCLPEKKELSAVKTKLIAAGTRGGSTDKYLYSHNDSDMVSITDSSFRSSQVPDTLPKEKTREVIGVLTARIGKPIRLTIENDESKVTVAGPVTERARKPKDIAEELTEKISRTGDGRIDIGNVILDIDKDAFIPVGVVKDLRRKAVFEFLGGVNVKRGECLPFKPLEDRYHKNRESDQILITCISKEQLEAVGDFDAGDFSVIIAINYELYRRLPARYFKGKGFWLCLPDILRFDRDFSIDDDEVRRIFDGVIVQTYDEIEYVKERLSGMPFITDTRIYSWSDRSRKSIMSDGPEFISAPIELNQKELKHLDNSSSILSIYGRTPVMYTSACQHKNADGCDRRQTLLFLKDERKAGFPVINYCSFCTNVVYNSVPTSLLPYVHDILSMGFAGVRFDFTTENAKQVKEVLNIFIKNIYESARADVSYDVTRGHFHRGAE
ncbi:MAG: U32 family peptidase [Lachnospiraceae bacterium]|uniref:U32 family peptidase n=1 Tax=Candidatus Weimeria bifida TaxID=2599074 RepID=A0A6N7IYT9_9FIRM|nr:U32 family peptidase [Candidatus Weimeria bifida]RRF95369.1 MAG: U32 family peptidase [Lachnospiraceae bacterium]